MATATLGQITEGSIIKLKENGTPVEFYVAKHNYESGLNGPGRTLVVRKDCYDNRVWDNGNVNAYASSDLDSWFNSTYKNMLDATIRSLIGTTKIRYTPGNGNNTVGTLERSIFALSLTELGESHSYANVEGSALPIASTLKIAYLNGNANTQWTRSPLTNVTNYAWWLNSNGDISNISYCRSTGGSRPAFTLPSNLYVSDDGSVFQNTAPSTPASISVPSSIDGGSTITVSWGTSTDAEGNLEGYIVERSTNGGSSWTRIYQGANTSTTNLVEFGTNTVQYRVKAYDSGGLESGYKTSSAVTVINNTAPSAPTAITVPASIPNGNSLNISWSASTDQEGNLSGYTLQRKTNLTDYIQVYQGPNTSYQDTAPSSGETTIQYRVQAYDTEGLTSSWKESASVSVLYPPQTPAITIPSLIMKNSTINLSWNSVGENITYTVERKSSANDEFLQIYSGPDLTCTDTIGYWSSVQYRIKATDANGISSDYSTGNSITIYDPLRVELPTGFNMGTNFDVKWTVNADATSYVLERKVNGGSYTVVYTGPSTYYTDYAESTWNNVQYRIKFIINENSSPWFESDMMSRREVSRQRIHRRNGDGTYTTIYPETSGDAVLMPDGSTLEETIAGTGSGLKFNTLVEYNKGGDR